MDWQLIDTEHGAADWETVGNMIRGIKGTAGLHRQGFSFHLGRIRCPHARWLGCLDLRKDPEWIERAENSFIDTFLKIKVK